MRRYLFAVWIAVLLIAVFSDVSFSKKGGSKKKPWSNKPASKGYQPVPNSYQPVPNSYQPGKSSKKTAMKMAGAAAVGAIAGAGLGYALGGGHHFIPRIDFDSSEEERYRYHSNPSSRYNQNYNQPYDTQPEESTLFIELCYNNTITNLDASHGLSVSPTGKTQTQEDLELKKQFIKYKCYMKYIEIRNSDSQYAGSAGESIHHFSGALFVHSFMMFLSFFLQ
nr:PREDICTED: major prion protein homolog [Latimeria chalumnae]|eukprot:XP_006009713.1 PREDICTED: major prion protein homolog [Latimeria chalumnae]